MARLCDHIIAVDGPYAAFPGALRKPFSGTEQADAILRTAAGAGIGCTLHASRQPWWGGEIEKRDYMFKLGSLFTTPDDWFLRIDADEVLTHIPLNTRAILKETSYDVAEVTLWEREASQHIGETVDTLNDYQQPFRCLFRALPGIHIEQTHYYVKAGDKVLNSGGTSRQVPAEDLTEIRLEHRTHQRTLARQRLKREYSKLINNFERVED